MSSHIKLDPSLFFKFPTYTPPKYVRPRSTDIAYDNIGRKVNELYSSALTERETLTHQYGKTYWRDDCTYDDWKMQPPLIYTKHAKQRIEERKRLGRLVNRYAAGTNKTIVATVVIKNKKRYV